MRRKHDGCNNCNKYFSSFLAYYKKELKKTLDSKEYPLKIFYGMGMFICDRIVKKAIGNNAKTNTLIDSLVVKDNTERERYLYTVKKITICILVMFWNFGKTE